MSTEAAIGRDLWWPFDGGGVAALTEAQLMDLVARRADSAEAAFEATLTRHGPAVLAAAVLRGLAMAAGLKAGAVVLARLADLRGERASLPGRPRPPAAVAARVASGRARGPRRRPRRRSLRRSAAQGRHGPAGDDPVPPRRRLPPRLLRARRQDADHRPGRGSRLGRGHGTAPPVVRRWLGGGALAGWPDAVRGRVRVPPGDRWLHRPRVAAGRPWPVGLARSPGHLARRQGRGRPDRSRNQMHRPRISSACPPRCQHAGLAVADRAGSSLRRGAGVLRRRAPCSRSPALPRERVAST